MATVTRLVSEIGKWTLTLEMDGDAVDGQSLTPSALAPGSVVYTIATTPPVSLYYADHLVGDSGTPSQTINLTAFYDIEGVIKDATGKKVQELRITADEDNAAAATIEGGDATPYELFGTANELDIEPGALVVMRFADQLADVSSGAKLIKVTLGHGDLLNIELVIG